MIDGGLYIGELNESLPANTDPRAEGGEQMRAIKRALLNTFPNLKGPINFSEDDFNLILGQGYQIGDVKMFYGLVEDVNPGWALCDGEIHNNVQTPDMRKRVPYGYDPEDEEAYPMGFQGGADELNIFKGDEGNGVSTEEHKLTKNELPKITEKMWGAYDNGDNHGGEAFLTGRERTGRDPAQFDKITVNGGDKGHSHKMPETIIDNRSQFTVLAYYMYVGA